MKVTFELPDNLLTSEEADTLVFFSSTWKQLIAQEIKRQLVDRYIKSHPDLEGLEIDKAELRKAVTERMADRAIERLEDE